MDVTAIIGQVIELRRANDTACKCGSLKAAIGAGKAMHAASLHCAGCGRHRGWLSEMAADALLETTELFGAPAATFLSPEQAFDFMKTAAPSGANAAAISSACKLKDCKMPATETDFDSMYGSKYFAASDLRGQVQNHKIGKVDKVSLREKDGTTKTKMAVWFDGVEKGLILNQTNATRLAAEYGKAPTAWVGKTVAVYAEETSYGMGTRLRPVKGSSGGPGKPAADMDDDLPF